MRFSSGYFRFVFILSCNYWICDGIIQLQQGDVVGSDDAAAETLWLSCDALKREM